MAKPDDAGLPEDPNDLTQLLREVAKAIGRFLPKSGPQLAIGEILPVWVITLDDLQSTKGLAKAEGQDLWQLQLRPSPGEQAVAFARVKDLAGAGEVQAVYFSPLARALDEAIDLADERYPEDIWRARLLALPEAHLTLLWLTRPGEDRLIFLDDALPGGGKWGKSEDLSGGEFQNRLQGLKPILGIVPGTEDDESDEAEDEDSGS